MAVRRGAAAGAVPLSKGPPNPAMQRTPPGAVVSNPQLLLAGPLRLAVRQSGGAWAICGLSGAAPLGFLWRGAQPCSVVGLGAQDWNNRQKKLDGAESTQYFSSLDASQSLIRQIGTLLHCKMGHSVATT